MKITTNIEAYELGLQLAGKRNVTDTIDFLRGFVHLSIDPEYFAKDLPEEVQEYFLDVVKEIRK